MGNALVYLVKAGLHYKIGRTKDLQRRVMAIQTSQPFPVKVIHAWTVVNGAAVEGYLHQKFNATKMEGEWYHLTQDDVSRLLEIEAWDVDVPPITKNAHVMLPAKPGSCRALLEEKTDIRSSTELREKIGGSAAQVSNLWHGRDTIGARLMLRILTAFPQISAQELAQVDEAKKALTPPKPPRSRHTPRKTEPPRRPE
jgi:hypothetical protein